MIIKINYIVNDLWRELEKKNSLIKQFIELDNMFFSFFGCHRSTDESVSLAHYPQKMAFLQQKFVKKIDLPSGGLRRRCPPSIWLCPTLSGQLEDFSVAAGADQHT